MSLTKEDWAAIQKELSFIYRSVELAVDGYRVCLMLHQSSAFKNVIMTYVNGHFYGAWMQNDCEERRRFMNPCAYPAYSRKYRTGLKALRKRTLKEMKIDPDKKLVYYLPFWTSFAKLKAHLIRNNKDIEWTNRPQPRQESEAR